MRSCMHLVGLQIIQDSGIALTSMGHVQVLLEDVDEDALAVPPVRDGLDEESAIIASCLSQNSICKDIPTFTRFYYYRPTFSQKCSLI